MNLHKEIGFENEICQHLAEHGWLYAEGDAAGYDRARALFSADVLAWVQETQAKAWEALVKNHGAQAGETLLARLRDQLDQRGTLDVLRHGIELLGLKQPLKLAEFKPAFDRLMKETNKPVFCGEFSFPPGYHGERGYGFYPSSVEDEAMAGKYYARWVQEAASNPYCVGTGWFQYRDEPLTGRGPGHGNALTYGENFAFGIVDVTDRPKWPLVKAMREANLAAVKRRLGSPAPPET